MNSILYLYFKYFLPEVLGEPYSNSLDSLNGFPSVKLLFRKLNARLPSLAPVEILFFQGVPHLLAKTEPPEWPEIRRTVTAESKFQMTHCT